MKSLQYKCATASPKDTQQGKERKRKDQSAKICMPCNETGLPEDLIHEVLGDSQKSGGGDKPWENPQITTSIGFMFTQVQVGMPTYLP